MSLPPLLSVQDVFVNYGKIEAVRGVSLDVPPGKIVTVVGTNGAGKTTLLGSIMGLLPTRGRILIDGLDQSESTVEMRVADRICLVPERRELFGTMSVEDNLLLGGFLLPSRAEVDRGIEQSFDRFPILKRRRTQVANTLSGGERQMLAMARALMSKPRLLMLDEPSLGLAPLIVEQIFGIIKELHADGVSILLVEQNARAALEVADTGYVMELGEITRSAPAKELLGDSLVIESYLGKT